MALITVETLLENGPRREKTTALFDTGAKTFAFIDSSLAARLGLPIGDAAPYTGVGGAPQMGFRSKLGRLTFVQNPDCSLSNFDVVVGKLGFAHVDLLVGENFIKSVGASVDFVPEGIRISCKRGPKVAIAEPISPYILVVGGAALLGIAAFLFLRD